jgi:hypothetical protein
VSQSVGAVPAVLWSDEQWEAAIDEAMARGYPPNRKLAREHLELFGLESLKLADEILGRR